MVMAMKTKTLKQLFSNLVSESQHHAMNTLMNMRYLIQNRLEPWLGREGAKKWAVGIVMIFEVPVKNILY
jgi:hypothetical protein